VNGATELHLAGLVKGVRDGLAGFLGADIESVALGGRMNVMGDIVIVDELDRSTNTKLEFFSRKTFGPFALPPLQRRSCWRQSQL
jgi:hypothetical protein